MFLSTYLKKSIPPFRTQGWDIPLEIYPEEQHVLQQSLPGENDDRNMFQIDLFMFLITGFYNLQQATHDRPTKSSLCHPNYLSVGWNFGCARK